MYPTAPPPDPNAYQHQPQQQYMGSMPPAYPPQGQGQGQPMSIGTMGFAPNNPNTTGSPYLTNPTQPSAYATAPYPSIPSNPSGTAVITSAFVAPSASLVYPSNPNISNPNSAYAIPPSTYGQIGGSYPNNSTATAIPCPSGAYPNQQGTTAFAMPSNPVYTYASQGAYPTQPPPVYGQHQQHNQYPNQGTHPPPPYPGMVSQPQPPPYPGVGAYPNSSGTYPNQYSGHSGGSGWVG